jgi:hypothetical protein
LSLVGRLGPESGGGLVQEDTADSNGAWHIVIRGERDAHIQAAFSDLVLAANGRGFQLQHEGSSTLAAAHNASTGTTQAVLPITTKSLLHIPGAALAAASSGIKELINRSNGFLNTKTMS